MVVLSISSHIIEQNVFYKHVTIKKNNFPPIIFELWGGRDWYAEKAEQTKNILTNWGYQFEVFGREILAQHPKYRIKCKVSRDGKNINLSLV
jgi:hypothetical protein